MASSKVYLDFVLEQLSGLEEITYRAMMGASSTTVVRLSAAFMMIDCLGNPLNLPFPSCRTHHMNCPMRAQKKCCWSIMLITKIF